MNIEYRKKISDEHNQGESQYLKPTNRNISNILHATNELLRIRGRFSPGRILAITIGGIALAEVFSMIVVYYVRDWPYYQQVLFDAAVMTAIIFPLLYFLSFKPLLLQIQQRYQSESIIQARLRLMQFANTHTLDELLQFTLDEIETLTGSTIGFFHFLEADQKTLWLQAWSTNTLQNMCKAEGKNSHYGVEQAGVWADAVRHRQPTLHNNYAALPHRKGMPEGHALVVREMVIPILRDKKVMAILGLGNKPQDFTANDVELVSTFADFAWDIVEHKRAENAIRKSEEKFRTLVDWTYDWEQWLDPRGNIVYTSPSCVRITGYSPEEIVADPNLLIRIAHPDDRQFYEEHQAIIHDESAGPISIEYRIISRDGSEHWIEHVCRPIFGPDDGYLGRRVSNRDISERKQAEKKIIEQNQKELILTQTIQTIQTDIAHDMHDNLGQNLAYLRLKLEQFAQDDSLQDIRDVRPDLLQMRDIANQSYLLVRDTLAELKAGATLDLYHLIDERSRLVAGRAKLKIETSVMGQSGPLNPQVNRQIFYIFREALNNIEKHANASRVDVSLVWGGNTLTIVVKDDGRGFDPVTVDKDKRFGLTIMNERIRTIDGHLDIRSIAGQGSSVTIWVPI